MKTLLAYIILLFQSMCCNAAESINIAEKLTVHSILLNEDRPIIISLPPGYKGGQLRYPVLYLMDGEKYIGVTRGVVSFLAERGLMPEMIIVGINNINRDADLSPVNGSYVIPSGAVRTVENAKGEQTLKWLSDELGVWIDSKYRTNNFKILFGHSLGGVLAVHAFVNLNKSFNAYISISPVLGWANGYLKQKLNIAFKDRPSTKSYLYMSIANEQSVTPADKFDEIVALIEKNVNKNLNFNHEKFLLEDHDTTVLPAMIDAFKRLYNGWRLALDGPKGTYLGDKKALFKHYADLGIRLGIELFPPEAVVNNVAYGWLSLGKHGEALDLFLENTKLYPMSANSFDSLGECQELLGMRIDALKSFGFAVELSKKYDDPRRDLFERNYRLAKERLVN